MPKKVKFFDDIPGEQKSSVSMPASSGSSEIFDSLPDDVRPEDLDNRENCTIVNLPVVYFSACDVLNILLPEQAYQEILDIAQDIAQLNIRLQSKDDIGLSDLPSAIENQIAAYFGVIDALIAENSKKEDIKTLINQYIDDLQKPGIDDESSQQEHDDEDEFDYIDQSFEAEPVDAAQVSKNLALQDKMSAQNSSGRFSLSDAASSLFGKTPDTSAASATTDSLKSFLSAFLG